MKKNLMDVVNTYNIYYLINIVFDYFYKYINFTVYVKMKILGNIINNKFIFLI